MLVRLFHIGTSRCDMARSTQDQQVKDALKESTADAVDRGAFGGR
jgi:2-hydroxychromene-2-carboxylate isomerase